MNADVCVMTHARDPDRPRRALDGLYLCHGHLEQLRRLVAELPARYDDLERAHGPGGPRNVTDAPGLAIDEQAARHRAHLAGVLASWCRVVAEDRGLTPPVDTGPAHTAPWMLTHIGWCAAHRWVDEMLTELRQATGRALALVDIPARRVPLAARCLTHVDGERCTGAVTITVRGDDWTAYCPTCDTVQEPTPYLRGATGQWITCEGVIVLARLHGIPCSRDVVRQWHHRRRITGRRDGDHTWYELASVQQYLARRERMAG